eukprot:scaffold164932_cov37-Prasinocladus_malaysianus.AAC.1
MKDPEVKSSGGSWTRIELLDPLETSVLMTAPSILTVTFYRLKAGSAAPIDWIRERVAQIVDANPWLAGRLRTEAKLGPGLYVPACPSADAM